MGEKQKFPPETSDIGAYNDALIARYDYDAVTRDQSWSVNELLQRALSAEQLAHVDAVLDLGTGTGQTITAVKALASPSSIVAVDASAGMLAKLRGKFPGDDVEPVHTLIQDYVANVGSDTKFGLVTGMGSMEFVPSLPGVLSATARLLLPGGSLVMTYIPRIDPSTAEKTFNIPSWDVAFTEYYWQPAELEESLTDQGFIVTQGQPFEAYTRGSGDNQEQVMYRLLIANRPS